MAGVGQGEGQGNGKRGPEPPAALSQPGPPGVRGNGPEPYDVQILWEGTKYPEWFLFAALRNGWAQGEFRIVQQGRESLLAKLMPF